MQCIEVGAWASGFTILGLGFGGGAPLTHCGSLYMRTLIPGLLRLGCLHVFGLPLFCCW